MVFTLLLSEKWAYDGGGQQARAERIHRSCGSSVEGANSTKIILIPRNKELIMDIFENVEKQQSPIGPSSKRLSFLFTFLDCITFFRDFKNIFVLHHTGVSSMLIDQPPL